MDYTRLFHQWFKTRPWSGLKQLPHWWRSVRHTHRNAKISSNVLICLFSQQSGPHWHSHSPLIQPLLLRQRTTSLPCRTCADSCPRRCLRRASGICSIPRLNRRHQQIRAIPAGYGHKPKKQIGTLEEILALRCVCFTLRQQLHECLSPDQGRVVGQLLK